jgi:multiple sugar transport system permease protein
MVGRRRAFPEVFRYLTLVIVLGIMVFPLLWMFRVSLMKAGGALALSALLAPELTFQSYLDLFAGAGMGRYLFNSLFVGTTVTGGNILFCFMVAYLLARHRNIGSRVLFGTVIAVLMIPVHVTIIPLYVLCFKAGIYDSYWALILPWLVNPLGIFLVKQYIEAIPPSMEEAARIDGAGELTILFRIMMPMCKPALAVLAIQVFFTNWNSFLFPFILTSRDELRTLPVALSLLQGHQAIDWQHLMAGSSIAVLPVLILFVVMQRHIVSGITAGAIKQ